MVFIAPAQATHIVSEVGNKIILDCAVTWGPPPVTERYEKLHFLQNPYRLKNGSVLSFSVVLSYCLVN